MNIIFKIKKSDWDLFERIPQAPFWFTCSPLSAYVSELQKLYQVGPFEGFYIFQDGDLFMYKKSGSLEEGGKQLLEKCQDTNFSLLGEILTEIDRGCADLFSKAQPLRDGTAYNNFSNFAQTFSDLYQIHTDIWVKGQAINLLEHGHSLLGKKLKNKIKACNIPEEEVASLIHILTTPELYTCAQKEEQELINLAKAPISNLAIEKHFNTYSFLGYGWNGPGFEINYFKDRLELLQKEKAWKKYERSEENYTKEVCLAKEKIIKQFNLSKDIVELGKLLAKIAYLKSVRVDASWFFYWSIEPYFKALAKEKSFSVSQIQFLKPEEIAKLLLGQEISNELPNARKKMYVIYFHNQIIEEFFGQEAKDIFNYLKQNTEDNTDDTTTLIGETGSPGKVTGIVKIIEKAAQIGKMNKGDILVSHTTNPTLVPAMKLAAGIVADIGGVTSHAAIISRELGIPSVVGTKNATRILKDGDRVELDANKGIVTKLG